MGGYIQVKLLSEIAQFLICIAQFATRACLATQVHRIRVAVVAGALRFFLTYMFMYLYVRIPWIREATCNTGSHQERVFPPQKQGCPGNKGQQDHAAHDQHCHKLDLSQHELDHHEREVVHRAEGRGSTKWF